MRENDAGDGTQSGVVCLEGGGGVGCRRPRLKVCGMAEDATGQVDGTGGRRKALQRCRVEVREERIASCAEDGLSGREGKKSWKGDCVARPGENGDASQHAATWLVCPTKQVRSRAGPPGPARPAQPSLSGRVAEATSLRKGTRQRRGTGGACSGHRAR